MIHRKEITLIKSLKHRKSREENGFFVAEGAKLVSDLIQSGLLSEWVFCTHDWLDSYPDFAQVFGVELTPIEYWEMERISTLANPSPVLAVFKIPPPVFLPDQHMKDLVLVLDDIRDPGNMGTILRTADWFGVRQIVCSQGSVDLFNPKVVQSSMGSVARVNVIEAELRHYLNSVKGQAPVYGTYMDGHPVYSSSLTSSGIIVIGNEGRGIASELKMYITDRIAIPGPIGIDRGGAESLNASIATALVVAEFRRQHSAF